MLLLLLLFIINYGSGQNISQINSLHSRLLNDYNKHTRPTNIYVEPVIVDIELSLISIRDFDEVQAKLSTVTLFVLSWTDDSFVWNPSRNNDVEHLVMSQNDVWKPLLTQSNPHTDIKEFGNKDWGIVHVFSDGTVQWDPLAVLETQCNIDIKYYPFNTQTCSIVMYINGYQNNEVTINVTQTSLNLIFYEGHATWNIVKTNIEYKPDADGYYILVTTLVLKRQPMFIIVNFLVPIFVLALLNPLVFLLPADSGERIGFSITILLSLSVFMTILGDYIPKNSNPMSLCAFMLMSLYACSAIIVVFVIVSSNIYFTDDKMKADLCASAVVKMASLKRRKAIDKGIEHINWKNVSCIFDKISLVIAYIFLILILIFFICILKNE